MVFKFTALVLIVMGLLKMLIMLPGMSDYSASTSATMLIASGVLVPLIVVVASVGGGWLAHVIQTRSGMSPWVVGPGTFVAVTAAAVVVVMFSSLSILTSITRRGAPTRAAAATAAPGG